MNNKTVRVYDTITKKYVEIEVSDEVYTYYKRTAWEIKNNNSSFYAHQLQFSMLNDRQKAIIDGRQGSVQERGIDDMISMQDLYDCLSMLEKDDKELIINLFFKQLTEKELAKKLHTTQQNINKKKKRILLKLYKLLR